MADTRTVESITDADLTALFAAHCECRPLDPTRTDDEHSHDCDTAILDDIQTALFAVDDDEELGARFRCCEHWNTDLDRRKFALGHGTVGHGRAAKYRGRGWLERLVDDAVAALQEALR